MAEELNVHGDRSRFARAPSREAILAGAAAFTAAGLVAALGLRAGSERP